MLLLIKQNRAVCMNDNLYVELKEMTTSHERRLNQYDVWKEGISNAVTEIKGWQQKTCKEMTETRIELIQKIEHASVASAAQAEKLVNIITSIQLENATEKGRREQSNKNLYLFIALMGLLPIIVGGIGILIFYFSGHKA